MSLDREKLLSHIRDSDARQVLVKLLDKAELVLGRRNLETTDFLDPYHLELAKGILRGLDISFLAGGGYPTAERCKLALGPEFKELCVRDLALSVLCIKGGSDFHTLTHRDYLGALLGLGIRREKAGDILVQQEQAWVVLDEGMADFVCQNLSRVGRVPVQIAGIGPEDIVLPQASFKDIRTTVPSLRLDAVAGEGFGLSRGKITAEIASGKLKINWRPVEQASAKVSQGDLISCRGLGRITLAEVKGETKKGRIAIVIKRMI